MTIQTRTLAEEGIEYRLTIEPINDNLRNELAEGSTEELKGAFIDQKKFYAKREGKRPEETKVSRLEIVRAITQHYKEHRVTYIHLTDGRVSIEIKPMERK